MAGLQLALVVAGAVVAGTAVLVILGVLIDRSAERYEREELR